MFKKLVCSVVLSSVVLSIPISAEIRDITLLHTNDIESVYDPIDAFWDKDIDQIGGMAYLSTLINQQMENSPTPFLFDSGDIFTGSLSKTTLGELPFDIYAAMGYDAMTLGNHEFEYGWQRLLQVKDRAHFPTLNANIVYKGTDINYARPFTIIEKNGVRVGVIGVMGIDAFINTIMPAHVKELEVRDPIETAQKYVDMIHEDVDVVVVLTHQNRTAPMQTDKEADPEVQRGYDEDWMMAGKINNVDVILGGHSDNGLWEPVQHPETGTWVGLTFGQGKYLGKIDASIDTDTGKFFVKKGQLIPVESKKLKANPAIENLINKARSDAPHLSEVVGYIDKTAYRRYYRESNIGNMITDIMRHATGADIAAHNSGSIRYDINKGKVTRGNILDVSPFKSKLATVELTGAQVVELLEYSYELAYGIVQMSGVETIYDSKKPIGSRLIDVKINGQKIDLTKAYTVAATSFMATGGDGFSMLKDGRNRKIEPVLINEMLIDYFENNKSITIPDVGRQIDISRK